MLSPIGIETRIDKIKEYGGELVPITITDINSEISDADNVTNSIKFKYSSHHLPIPIDYLQQYLR